MTYTKEEHKMFFFIYSEIGELEHNVIVKSAFEKMMFEKLQSEGYCDINPLIGRPRTSKSEIENNLKKLDSPLVKVFAGKYATNTEELEKIMLPVLKELEEKLSKNKSSFDEYNYFAIIYFILKLLHWNDFPAGMTPILLGVFVIGSMQLFFIGLLGEYIMNMNARLMNRPLVIEQERINFDKDEK